MLKKSKSLFWGIFVLGASSHFGYADSELDQKKSSESREESSPEMPQVPFMKQDEMKQDEAPFSENAPSENAPSENEPSENAPSEKSEEIRRIEELGPILEESLKKAEMKKAAEIAEKMMAVSLEKDSVEDIRRIYLTMMDFVSDSVLSAYLTRAYEILISFKK